MRWTVLSDNRSYDSCLFTEHGLSVLLQTERHKILLDTGASDVFVRNAEQLGIAHIAYYKWSDFPQFYQNRIDSVK